MATMRGIVVGNLPSATDYSAEGYEERADLARDTLRKLDGLAATNEDDQLAADFLRERLVADLALHDSGETLRQVRAPFGLTQSIRDSIDLLPRTGDGAWEAITARLAAVPAMLDSWRRGLSTGLDSGFTAARRQALESATHAERLAGRNSAPPTFEPLLAEHGDGPLATELRATADQAHAAYAETAQFL